MEAQNNFQEKYAFTLAFIAIFWKRILSTTILFCKHQNINFKSSEILKCLKYNLLSPTGFFYEVEPYLKKAFKNGFLMHGEFKDNIYIKEAIQLFGETYKISKIEGEEERKKYEMKFIYNFGYDAFNEDEKNNEYKDIIKNIPNFKENIENIENIENKHCTFCELDRKSVV